MPSLKTKAKKAPSKKKSKKNKESVLVCSAHSDDFVLGAGSTIAKYAKEGKKVHCLVFSYGEMSHPWLKPKEVQQMRLKEAQDAAKLLGATVEFLDLQEGNFLKETEKKKAVKKFIEKVKRRKVNKVFTHSSEDPHPDHRAVHKITLQSFEQLSKAQRPEVYVYSVWNPIEFNTDFPALCVDIKGYFKIKAEALKKFPSQKVHVIYPSFMSFFRAFRDGIKIRKLMVEKFYRIR